MTTVPESASLTSGYTATYDAWNRLVSVADESTAVADSQYDGRGYRTVDKTYYGGPKTRHAHFTDDWRVVEERMGTATTAAGSSSGATGTLMSCPCEAPIMPVDHEHFRCAFPDALR